MSTATRRTRRWQRIAAALTVSALAVGATTLAAAKPLTGGLADLRPVPGSGQFRFAGTSSTGAAVAVVGTVTTKVVPATIKPGQPVTFTVRLTWTDTDQNALCSFGSSGSTPGQTSKGDTFPLQPIRPGRGDDLSVANASNAEADTTRDNNGATWTCGPPNRITRTEGYVARVSGAATAKYPVGCYAANPSAGYAAYAYLRPGATYEGTFATLSVGGVDCTGGATAVVPATAFSDTFSAAGQAKPHAVAVPAAKTRAELTLRWTKPGDRFTIANVVLVPKRKTASVAQAEKLKITFFSVTPTSMGVRITNLAPGKLTFRIVSKKQNGTTTVRTRVILKA